jgi:hypothetical protein
MPSRGASAGWLLRGRAGAAVWAEGCFPRACGGLGPGGVRMRGRSDGGMTTPCRPSVAWHVPVRGPLEFPGVRGVRVPTAQKLASQRISAGQRHVLGRAERAACKTVGSAYDGSNPSPATTSGNGPLAANSRASGAFLLCPVVCHLVALWTVILRCPRTHSGRESGPGSGVDSRLTGAPVPISAAVWP